MYNVHQALVSDLNWSWGIQLKYKFFSRETYKLNLCTTTHVRPTALFLNMVLKIANIQIMQFIVIKISKCLIFTMLLSSSFEMRDKTTAKINHWTLECLVLAGDGD